MPESKLPYMLAHGVITKALQKIKSAATPERFTQDFLSTKLGMKGGNYKPVIPFLKRTGFLGSDGVPTELYKAFRNPAESGRAAAQAVKTGYSPLFEMNENAHELSDEGIMGLIVQATGLEVDSRTAKAILWSLKALKEFAKFGEPAGETESPEIVEGVEPLAKGFEPATIKKFGLSYTINLNLPATSDIAVFDAIFKSLREHLLKE